MIYAKTDMSGMPACCRECDYSLATLHDSHCQLLKLMCPSQGRLNACPLTDFYSTHVKTEGRRLNKGDCFRATGKYGSFQQYWKLLGMDENGSYVIEMIGPSRSEYLERIAAFNKKHPDAPLNGTAFISAVGEEWFAFCEPLRLIPFGDIDGASPTLKGGNLPAIRLSCSIYYPI